MILGKLITSAVNGISIFVARMRAQSVPQCEIVGDSEGIPEILREVGFTPLPEKRARGLMEVSELANNKGMLFIFDEKGIYPFWMKDTLIPLDILWIGENKKITTIVENATGCYEEPCDVFRPYAEALYVLEINAGISKQNNFSINDEVSFK